MRKTNKIRNNSNPKEWYYIPTNLNIVDEFSRGVKFNDLYQHTIETDLDPVTGNSSDQIIDPSINVNRHHPSNKLVYLKESVVILKCSPSMSTTLSWW